VRLNARRVQVGRGPEHGIAATDQVEVADATGSRRVIRLDGRREVIVGPERVERYGCGDQLHVRRRHHARRPEVVEHRPAIHRHRDAAPLRDHRPDRRERGAECRCRDSVVDRRRLTAQRDERSGDLPRLRGGCDGRGRFGLFGAVLGEAVADDEPDRRHEAEHDEEERRARRSVHRPVVAVRHHVARRSRNRAYR
jgi:hypothetical protein